MIGLTLVLSVAAASASQNFPPDKSCDAADDRQIVECLGDQYRAWDRALNAEYKAAMIRLDTSRKPLLLKSQRIWVQYRDANCAIGFAHEGTVSGYLGEQCLLSMTRDRARELRELHVDDTN